MDVVFILTYLIAGFCMSVVSIPAAVKKMKNEGELPSDAKAKMTKGRISKMIFIMTLFWLPLFLQHIVNGAIRDIEETIGD